MQAAAEGEQGPCAQRQAGSDNNIIIGRISMASWTPASSDNDIPERPDIRPQARGLAYAGGLFCQHATWPDASGTLGASSSSSRRISRGRLRALFLM